MREALHTCDCNEQQKLPDIIISTRNCLEEITVRKNKTRWLGNTYRSVPAEVDNTSACTKYPQQIFISCSKSWLG